MYVSLETIVSNVWASHQSSARFCWQNFELKRFTIKFAFLQTPISDDFAIWHLGLWDVIDFLLTMFGGQVNLVCNPSEPCKAALPLEFATLSAPPCGDLRSTSDAIAVPPCYET